MCSTPRAACRRSGLTITLYRIDGEARVALGQWLTNADGRCDEKLLDAASMRAGTYEVVFDVGGWRRDGGQADAGFYDLIPIRFVAGRRRRALPHPAAAFALQLQHLSRQLTVSRDGTVPANPNLPPLAAEVTAWQKHRSGYAIRSPFWPTMRRAASWCGTAGSSNWCQAARNPRSPHRLFDASAHVVLPGLINTHHHFYQTLTRALPAALDRELFAWLGALYPVWARLTPEAHDAASTLAMAELLLSGCTTTTDHHYVFPAGLEEAIDIQVAAAQRLGHPRGADARLDEPLATRMAACRPTRWCRTRTRSSPTASG